MAHGSIEMRITSIIVYVSRMLLFGAQALKKAARHLLLPPLHVFQRASANDCVVIT